MNSTFAESILQVWKVIHLHGITSVERCPLTFEFSKCDVDQ